MAVFHYLVKNDEGSRNEGDIRAESMDLALQKLTTNGQIVITLKEVDTTFDFLGPFLDEINLTFERIKNRVPLANIVFFTRQLATMFSAGLTLERAIQALAVEEKHKKFKKILTEVGSSIRKGLNLSESLARHPGVFNNLFVAMTKAGEVSGNLNEILDQLASYLENLDDTRRKVKGAMTYPIFMVIFLGCMVLAMLVWIIPKFSEVYAQLGASLPGATKKMMDASAWLTENLGFMFFNFILVFFILFLIYDKPKPSKEALPFIVGSGLSNACASTCFLLAVNRGLLSITSLLSALYPAITVVLAHFLIKEKMTRTQVFGVVAAIFSMASITIS